MQTDKSFTSKTFCFSGLHLFSLSSLYHGFEILLFVITLLEPIKPYCLVGFVLLEQLNISSTFFYSLIRHQPLDSEKVWVVDGAERTRISTRTNQEAKMAVEESRRILPSMAANATPMR